MITQRWLTMPSRQLSTGRRLTLTTIVARNRLVRHLGLSFDMDNWSSGVLANTIERSKFMCYPTHKAICIKEQQLLSFVKHHRIHIYASAIAIVQTYVHRCVLCKKIPQQQQQQLLKLLINAYCNEKEDKPCTLCFTCPKLSFVTTSVL
jgi:hypothetical protein